MVHKAVSPVNPMDVDRMHIFIVNNIFYSYAVDTRDTFKDQGGDAAAHEAANNDLKVCCLVF